MLMHMILYYRIKIRLMPLNSVRINWICVYARTCFVAAIYEQVLLYNIKQCVKGS